MMNQIIAENQALRRQLDMANQQIASLTAEVGRLATMMALANERLLELMAVAQRRTARPVRDAKAPPPAPTATPAEAAAYAARPIAPPMPEKPEKVDPAARKLIHSAAEKVIHPQRSCRSAPPSLGGLVGTSLGTPNPSGLGFRRQPTRPQMLCGLVGLAQGMWCPERAPRKVL